MGDQLVVDLFELEQDLLSVYSASRQEEPLNETPVPVTVITRDMIRAIGARNLLDVLITYVPGMTLVADQNEYNVAMHGVYASAQQKILVLVDGHRLNSRAYSMAAPDFSISLDRVKQIEVLRGPGSPLYGNVALTAVVNLVTRSGREADGATARVGIGNYGQRTANVTVGTGFGDTGDVMMWGSIYTADGQKVPVSADQDVAASPRDGFAIVDGFRDPYSYDLGISARSGNFKILANTRSGKMVDPFTSTGMTGEVYEYDAIRKFRGQGPGLASTSNHLELNFSRSIGESFEIELTGNYDTNDFTTILSGAPSTAASSYVGWNDDALGAIVQGRYRYELGIGKGNVTFGAQIDRMRLLDSVLAVGEMDEWTRFADTSARQLLAKGSETIYSGFVQLKQHIFAPLILNVGVRYDLKKRHKGDDITDLSPRAALIYTPNNWFDLKLSYAQSFVDAPYWYRYNSLASYRGAESLMPEHMRSVQLTPTVSFLDGRLKNTVNFFYNHMYDLVFRNNQAAPTEPLYQNSGSLKTVGVEEELAFIQNAYQVRANVVYQHLLEGRDYGTRGSQIFNIPNLTGNLVVDFNPLYRIYKKAWANVTLRYVGEQLSPIDVRFPSTSFVDPDNTVPAYALINAGVRLSDVYFDGLSIDATVYNVLDTQYVQGGSTTHPYPQAGRWFMVNLQYHFSI
ncbi:MAG: TonB-dependent receptor [Myxococcaceae bacterium]